MQVLVFASLAVLLVWGALALVKDLWSIRHGRVDPEQAVHSKDEVDYNGVGAAIENGLMGDMPDVTHPACHAVNEVASGAEADLEHLVESVGHSVEHFLHH